MRLQELIDRLLDWGRMESGRKEFVLQPTDPVEVVRHAVAAFEPVSERRRTELSLKLPEGEYCVDADRAALEDAVFNLLTNAHKYGGDPAKIDVELSVAARDVRISVSDNGPGIPLSEHKRIFQKFYRVDDRLSREREGSGLGLAIVKHVMRAHRGGVELDSAPGEGSTFTLVIPKMSREKVRRSRPDAASERASARA
jgi:two-component system phosphate regulon sensor histidine kinase PhoR